MNWSMCTSIWGLQYCLVLELHHASFAMHSLSQSLIMSDSVVANKKQRYSQSHLKWSGHLIDLLNSAQSSGLGRSVIKSKGIPTVCDAYTMHIWIPSVYKRIWPPHLLVQLLSDSQWWKWPQTHPLHWSLLFWKWCWPSSWQLALVRSSTAMCGACKLY